MEDDTNEGMYLYLVFDGLQSVNAGDMGRFPKNRPTFVNNKVLRPQTARILGYGPTMHMNYEAYLNRT